MRVARAPTRATSPAAAPLAASRNEAADSRRLGASTPASSPRPAADERLNAFYTVDLRAVRSLTA